MYFFYIFVFFLLLLLVTVGNDGTLRFFFLRLLYYVVFVSSCVYVCIFVFFFSLVSEKLIVQLLMHFVNCFFIYVYNIGFSLVCCSCSLFVVFSFFVMRIF